jgi:hemerythrin-like metal-binding protein
VIEHFQLGAPAIDQQHQALFVSFRKLATVGDAALPEVVMSDALSDLTKQIIEHFRTEEAFMLELGMPDNLYQAHRAAHISIMEEVVQIHLGTMRGKKHSLSEIITTVANWVQLHLVDFDLALKPYISELKE